MSEGRLLQKINKLSQKRVKTLDLAAVFPRDIEILLDEAKAELMPVISDWFDKLKEEYSGTSFMPTIEAQHKLFVKWFGEVKT